MKNIIFTNRTVTFNMVTGNKHAVKLPGEFKKYFWDVEFDELTIKKHPRFIAERILNYGNMGAIKWLFSWADKSYIRTIVDNSQNLNAKTRNFWKIMLTQDPE